MRIGLQEINLKDKIDDFYQYLETTDRIILSAKFGDGKTYFLNQLRQDETLNKEYKFFTIYPVNYSVAKNEDVFEYIKRDIILQLNKESLLDKFDMDAAFDSLFSFDDLKKVVSFLLSFIKGGAVYDKIFNKFCEKVKEYEEKKHTANKYLASFSQIKGSIYEEDGYTIIIRNAINWMKEDHTMNGPNWEKKKPVLIVEDLDRLDPKHLFRILNVLSAHIDDSSKPDIVTNKFGFNNIVLVMDYKTTEHIFHHFYGKEACYEGYMSKFLSREPFKYSILPFMVSQIKQEISTKIGIAHIFDIFTNFQKRLNQMSIRDMKKLTSFDTNDRIKKDVYEYQDIKFSTSLPLFHLIIFMIESGMSPDEIVADLNTKIGRKLTREMRIDISEYMRLMYPFYALKNEIFRYISYYDVHFYISTTKNNGIITNIQTVETMSWDNSVVILEKNNIEEVIKWCLDSFSSSINTAAL